MDGNTKTTVKAVVLILITLFFIKALDLSYPLSITTTTRSSELSVVGEGKAEAMPDIAYIDAGVTVNNGTSVSEVQNNINKVNNAVLQAVQKIGIEKKDITTSAYSINPNYSVESNEDRISGYNGNATITIKVRDTKVVSQVLNVVTTAGANQVRGVRFEIEDLSKIREKARNQAIQNAKDQADRLAKTLGIRLGKITNIVESSSDQPLPFMQRSAVEGIGVGGLPDIAPGTQTVSSTVTLFFEKK